jgi:hypothetical protein
VARGGADGDLPRGARHRAVRAAAVHAADRAAGRRALRFVDALDPDLFKPDGEGASRGEIAEQALARQPEIIGFLEGFFGAYPFRLPAGSSTTRSASASRWRRRPGRSTPRPSSTTSWPPAGRRARVRPHVVRRRPPAGPLAGHLAQRRLRDLREWLWQEEQGLATAQALFDERLALPADHPLWAIEIGDPGPATDQLFHPAVYDRGAMTLHALRLRIGDERFFRLVRTWAATQAGDTVSTPEFVALAERVAGSAARRLVRRMALHRQQAGRRRCDRQHLPGPDAAAGGGSISTPAGSPELSAAPRVLQGRRPLVRFQHDGSAVRAAPTRNSRWRA